MQSIFRRLFGQRDEGENQDNMHRHLAVSAAPAAVYAIGDVHGCLDALRGLERQIIADGSQIVGQKLIVMLGDYIDRGPNSAAVIDHLLAAPPPGFSRVNLMGNHEVMARDFFQRPQPRSDWLQYGGRETLHSYGISDDAMARCKPSQWPMLIKAHIPQEHEAFLSGLAWTLEIPGWLFVHAGIKPGIPVQDQRPDDLFWIRNGFYDTADGMQPEEMGFRVVHGHTPASDVVVTSSRICIDTGAYASGILTALKITPDGKATLLQTGV